MKVLTRGEYLEKTYEASCRKCNSVLEFTEKDCTLRNDGYELVLHTNCPVCSDDIWVSNLFGKLCIRSML